MLIDLSQRSGNAASAASKAPQSIVLSYVLICIGFSITILLALIWQNQSDAYASVYCIVLFAICLGPILIGRHNFRHRLLAMFMGCYFLIFGFHTMMQVLLGGSSATVLGTKEPDVGSGSVYALTSDLVVILGALSALAGYSLSLSLRRQKPSTFLDHEWRYADILWVGIATWAIGFTEIIAYDMNVSPLHIPTHVLGIPLGIAANFRLLSPIGGMILIYLLGRGYRKRFVSSLLFAIIAAECICGFIINSKEISFRIAMLFLVGPFFLGGGVSKKVLVAMLVVIVPYMLFFNAYRTIILEREYKTPAQAFEAFSKNIETVRHQTEGQVGVVSGSLESLSQRVDGKIYIDIIVAGTDSNRVTRLYGESIGWLFESFIPRFMWSEKPDISIGQRFNHEFHLSESRYTFVPTTQLGELYWNFGMPGVIVGMLCIGMIIGRLACSLLDQANMTAPRFIMLLMSTYYIMVRFEDNIANTYAIFFRLLILIWLADRVLRLIGVSHALPPAGATVSDSVRAAPRLMNLLPR